MTKLDKTISILNILIFLSIVFMLFSLPFLITLMGSLLALILFILIPLILILVGTFNIFKYLKMKNRKLKEFSYGLKFLLLFPAVNFMIIIIFAVVILVFNL